MSIVTMVLKMGTVDVFILGLSMVANVMLTLHGHDMAPLDMYDLERLMQEVIRVRSLGSFGNMMLRI